MQLHRKSFARTIYLILFKFGQTDAENGKMRQTEKDETFIREADQLISYSDTLKYDIVGAVRYLGDCSRELGLRLTLK